MQPILGALGIDQMSGAHIGPECWFFQGPDFRYDRIGRAKTRRHGGKAQLSEMDVLDVPCRMDFFTPLPIEQTIAI